MYIVLAMEWRTWSRSTEVVGAVPLLSSIQETGNYLMPPPHSNGNMKSSDSGQHSERRDQERNGSEL